MEKRFLLAIILSIIILMVYDYYIKKQQAEWRALHPEAQQEEPATVGPPEGEADKVTVEADSEDILKPVEPVPVPAVPPVDTPCKEVVVDTPLYRAVFCSHSGRPMSWRLKRYQLNKSCKCPFWGGKDASQIWEDPDSSVERIHVQGKDELSLGLEITFDKNNKEAIKEVLTPDHYQLTLEEGQSPAQLVFSGSDIKGRPIKRIYTFSPDEYLVDLEVEINDLDPRLAVAGMGLRLNDRIDKDGASRYVFTGFMIYVDDRFEKEKEIETGDFRNYSGKVAWQGFSDKYFLNAVIPRDNPVSSVRVEQLAPLPGEDTGLFRSKLTYNIQPHMTGRDARFAYNLYFGPKDLRILRASKHSLEAAVDLGWFSFVAKPLLMALNFFYKYTHNYGIAIIIITIIIKIFFYPLTRKQYESMKAMQKLQPKMMEIREKFKDDKERMNREIMDFYRTNKVNPLSGCWPMLLQIPVFFAFYRALMSSIELRHAPFMLWIQDLSAKDPCYITPIVMGATMFLQQKMTPMAGDPAQQKMMQLLPLIFTFFFLNFPSGLVLYWLVNNILSIGQQYIQQRQQQ